MPRTPSSVLLVILKILLVPIPFLSSCFLYISSYSGNLTLFFLTSPCPGTGFSFVCTSYQGLLGCPFLSLFWTKCAGQLILFFHQLFFFFSEANVFSSSEFTLSPGNLHRHVSRFFYWGLLCSSVVWYICVVHLLCPKVRRSVSQAYCQMLHLPSLATSSDPEVNSTTTFSYTTCSFTFFFHEFPLTILQSKSASSLCAAGRGRGGNDITGVFNKVSVIQHT